ncbi:unnamed protein product [Cyprideis torosa]|uniref:Uncharacterized protein n=1 Tax=Cyprideis torosa TaxID=163714 RepID=A0A7R8WK30_9CRUS|nr:unnamed protein product [Cyprideis torosa]CAG0896646.1 unnamed protein product [Cyprideis torosa]
MDLPLSLVLLLSFLSSMVPSVASIRCYQCSSSEDREGEDNCGAYESFDPRKHIPVECTSDESVTAGTFCMKLTQQGPKGFIWDGRWRQVIRRCASVSESGVTGVCNWGIDENSVYWEQCYCAEDECNSAQRLMRWNGALVTLVSVIFGIWLGSALMAISEEYEYRKCVTCEYEYGKCATCEYEYGKCVTCEYEYGKCATCEYEYGKCVTCEYEYGKCVTPHGAPSPPPPLNVRIQAIREVASGFSVIAASVIREADVTAVAAGVEAFCKNRRRSCRGGAQASATPSCCG